MESLSYMDGLLCKKHLLIRDTMYDDFYYLQFREIDFKTSKYIGEVRSLFTRHELDGGMKCYDKNHPSNIKLHLKTGVIFKLSYNNNCGVFVDKYLCKFQEYDKLGAPVYRYAMFTPREMRRAKERYVIYMKGGVSRYITKAISKLRAFKNHLFCE